MRYSLFYRFRDTTSFSRNKSTCAGGLSVHPTLPSLRAMHAAGCFGRYARQGNSGNHYKACFDAALLPPTSLMSLPRPVDCLRNHIINQYLGLFDGCFL